MPRPLRCDRPGALFHVTNRGQSHAPIFETQADVNCFLSLLDEAVKRGAIKVIAYCILATHFHLLVCSTKGTLALEMQRILSLYARWFNRTREHGGHTFEGRYFAGLVEDDVYLVNVIAYIDRNPVAAGLVSDPRAYPFGSARYHASGTPPAWLDTAVVQRLVRRITGLSTYSSEQYLRIWTACGAGPANELVARACSTNRVTVAPLAVLSQAGPAGVQRWLAENTLREEGRTQPVLLLTPSAVLQLVRDALAGDPKDPSGVTHVHGVSEHAVRAGLLYTIAGLTTGEVATMLERARSTTCVDIAQHSKAMAQQGAYTAWVSELVSKVLAAIYGGLLSDP